MITIAIVWVLEVKKVVFEIPGIFAEIAAPEAENYNRNPPKKIHKNLFMFRFLDWNILYSYRKLLNWLSLNISMQTRRKNIKKIFMIHFEPLHRSRRFKFSAVLVLKMAVA